MKRQTMSKGLPIRLKQLRQSLNWSQGQVAKKIGADVQRISKYERGIICPTTDMVVKIASAFNVSTDYLLLDDFKQNKEIDIQQIKNIDLLEKLEKLQELPAEDIKAVTLVLDAFIRKNGLRKLNETGF